MRLDQLRPFALLEPMVAAAGLFPNAQSAIERMLFEGRLPDAVEPSAGGPPTKRRTPARSRGSGPASAWSVWEFFRQVVFWFVEVPCLERKGRSSSRRLRSGSRSARKGVKGPKC